MSLEIRVARGGEVSTAGSGLGAVRARAMLQLLAPRSRTLEKDLLISFAIISKSARGKIASFGDSYQQPLTQPGGYLVFEIVHLPAVLHVSRRPILLQVFYFPIEDLKTRSSRRLDCVAPRYCWCCSAWPRATCESRDERPEKHGRKREKKKAGFNSFYLCPLSN